MARHTWTQKDILAAVIGAMDTVPDAEATAAAAGGCLVAVRSRRVGLAAAPAPDCAEGGIVPPPKLAARSTKSLARRLLDSEAASTMDASLAMAALNSLLPPPPGLPETKAQDLLLPFREDPVAVIGHFPFVERLEGFKDLTVLELVPRPGDLPAARGPGVLPRAEAVLVTATTLLNSTLAPILSLCRPEAMIILAGPTAPFASGLFEAGISVVAGCEVTDPEAAMAGVAAGLPFRRLPGVRSLIWQRG